MVQLTMFRGGFGNKKGTKQKRHDSRKNLPFSRVSAEIQIESTKQVLDSRVFLTDLTPSGVGCFVDKALDKGTVVAIVIEQPKHLFVKGEVIWCSPYTLETKIIATEQFRYRVGIKFLFDDAEDQEALKQYCEDLYTKGKGNPPPQKK